MLYYRFRPFSPLSVKELLYDELYFSYPHELNDPLDGMITYIFREDYPKWKRLIEFAWKDLPFDASKVAENFASKCPLKLSEKTITLDFILQIILDSLGKISTNAALLLSKRIHTYLFNYKPSNACSVSMSKTYDNALMWSHYANKHEGYCLIFRSINDKILPTPRIHTVDKSHRFEKGFEIHDVIYSRKREEIDAFTIYPWGVYGTKLSHEEHLEYHKKIQHQFLTKSQCWNYEQEARLLIYPSSVLVNKNHLPATDRIFHYDNSQIAGVIFGMRMSESSKATIRNILLKKSKERTMGKGIDKYLFNIVTFESNFNDDSHSINIQPSELFDDGNIIRASEPEFCEKFTSWTSGEALHIQYTEKGTILKSITLD